GADEGPAEGAPGQGFHAVAEAAPQFAVYLAVAPADARHLDDRAIHQLLLPPVLGVGEVEVEELVRGQGALELVDPPDQLGFGGGGAGRTSFSVVVIERLRSVLEGGERRPARPVGAGRAARRPGSRGGGAGG